MKCHSRIPLALMALLGGAACAGPSMPVPVSGDIARLTGQWTGEYESRASGRVGSIVFTLEAGKDTARGDVIMIPATLGQPVEIMEAMPPGVPGGETLRSRLLTIAFVQATATRVQGRLDPYRDPECGCELVTTFTGSLSGDVLEGTYQSFHKETGKVVSGTWRVTRQHREQES